MSTYFVDEEYENINFLGKTIKMPSSERIGYYVDKMNEVIKAYQEVEDRIKQQVNKCKSEGSGAWAWIQSEFYIDSYDFDDNGELVIDLLQLMRLAAIDICPHGDSSENYGEYTKGYRELERLRTVLVREARDIESAYERSYQTGSSLAYSSAASNIKGLGYGIITNSGLDLMAYRAVSNMAIRSQAKRADEQYTRDLKALAKSTGDVYKSRLLSLMYEAYVPNALACIKLWANEMTERLIEYEVKYNNNRVFAEINNYNPESAQAKLDSISVGEEPEEIKKKLLEAFTICPYSKSLYLKIVELGWMDESLYSYASGIGGDDYFLGIREAAKSACRSRMNDINFVKKCIAFMVSIVVSEEELLSEIYKPHAGDVEQRYTYLRGIINDEYKFKKFIRTELGINDIEKFINMNHADVEEKLKKYVYGIIDKELWDVMVENQFISIDRVALSESCDYEEINNIYVDNLTKNAINYMRIMESEFTAYRSRLEEYESKCNLMNSEIDNLQAELGKIGILGFSKKKQLKAKIADKKTEYYNYTMKEKPTLSWK